MILLCLGVSTFMASELFLRLPLLRCLQRIISNATKATSVLRSRKISDEWKEKVLSAYAIRIGANSILVFLFMLAAVSPFILLGLLMKEDFAVAMLRFDVLIGITVLGIGYVLIRRPSLCRTIP